MKKGLQDIWKKDISDNLFWKGYWDKILYAECDDDTLKKGKTYTFEIIDNREFDITREASKYQDRVGYYFILKKQ